MHHYSEPSGDLEAAVDLNWAEWPIHKFYRQVSDVSDVDWQAEWSDQVHDSRFRTATQHSSCLPPILDTFTLFFVTSMLHSGAWFTLDHGLVPLAAVLCLG